MILNPGALISNRYEIIERIGTGGMAIVYKAKDIKLERIVALKVMREEYVQDKDFITRFSVEAQAAAKLSHPNIVTVYDVGQEHLIYYIVMEFIDGTTLKDFINEKAPFNNEDVLNLAAQITLALQHAHSNNIVHRDIKPDNIMVTSTGIAKVTDFGIARAVTSSTVTADTTMGSVHYFSPEQARGGYVDFKSDIYSLGIVMYEMATGILPFDGDSAVSIALKHLNEPIPDITLINPFVSENLNRIILKATQKNSINRYENITEMLRDIKLALSSDVADFISDTEYKIDKNKTITMSKKDLDAIRTESREPDYEEQKKDYKIPEEEYYDYEDYYDEGETEPTKKKGIEKKVTIAAIITGLIIVLILSLRLKNYINSSKLVPVDLPDKNSIVGIMSQKDIENLANELNIKIIPEEVNHESIAEGNVVDIDMLGLSELYPGDSLKVLISKGKESYSVPNFSGKDINATLNELVNNEYLKFSNYTSEPNDDYDNNCIISQDPAPGTEVTKNTKISFKVSNGPIKRGFEVPNFKGQDIQSARNTCATLGLLIEKEEETSSKTIEKGKVISQNLLPGRMAQENDKIAFVISSGPENTEVEPSTSSEIETDNPNPNNNNNTGLKHGYFKIIDSIVPEGEASVVLKITEIKNGMTKVILPSITLTNNDFPFVQNIEGEGIVHYMIYRINSDGIDEFISEETVDFDTISN